MQTAGGREALGLLRAAAASGHAFEITVFDHEMPEMDGVTLAAAIKADDLIGGTRLIAMTPRGRRSDGAFRSVDIIACLGKPVKQSHLYKSLLRGLSEAADGPASSLEPIASAPPVRPPRRAPARVLMAEDNAINQMVAVSQLQRLGYEVDAVANGAEALQALARKSYDLVLMAVVRVASRSDPRRESPAGGRGSHFRSRARGGPGSEVIRQNGPSAGSEIDGHTFRSRFPLDVPV